jgi:hypothetical protein
MNVRYFGRSRAAILRLALLGLVLCAGFQFLCFRRWPGAPMFDLGYSILAAQNLFAHGKLASLNMLADFHDDLAQAAHLRWLVHFPPGQSLLYVAAMSLGLSAGAATKLLVLLGILFGGTGWIVLARYLKAPPAWLLILAVTYPWLPFTGSAYSLYETEHVAGALMPWFCLVLLQLVPLAARARPGGWKMPRGTGLRVSLAVALALTLVSFKYSMSPVFLAAGLFLLALSRQRVLRTPLWWKITIVGLMVAPVLLGLLVSWAYGPRLANTVALPPFAAILFVRDALENSITAPIGGGMLTWRFLKAAGWQTGRLLLDGTALAILAVFWLHLRAHPLRGRLRWFAVLLALLSVSLWLGLAVSSVAGQGQWNFGGNDRLYKPIVSMWLLFAMVALARLRPKDLVRSPAFFLCAIPVSLVALLLLKDALLKTPSTPMPRSRIAWTESTNPRHAIFLTDFAKSRSRKPDLMIGPSALMNEIETPSMGNGYFVPPGHHYRSSTPLEVWALVWPSQSGKLLAAFSGAQGERVRTPKGYPFDFYIFRLQPS